MATWCGDPRRQPVWPASLVAGWPEDRSKEPKYSLNHLTDKARLECMSTVRQVYIDNRESRLGNVHTVQELAEEMYGCILNTLPG